MQAGWYIFIKQVEIFPEADHCMYEHPKVFTSYI